MMMKILGYLSLYIKVETKELDPCYFEIKCDFRKPITRKVLRGFLRNAEKTVVEMKLTPTKVCYATEEEFLNSKTKTIWTDKWNDQEDFQEREI